MLGLAYANMYLRMDEAADSCHCALAQLYDARNWHGIRLLLEAAAHWFTDTGAVEPAGLVLGHLKAHHFGHGDLDRRHLEVRIRELRRRPDGDELLARGAAMQRDELLAYVLAELHPLAASSHESSRLS